MRVLGVVTQVNCLSIALTCNLAICSSAAEGLSGCRDKKQRQKWCWQWTAITKQCGKAHFHLANHERH